MTRLLVIDTETGGLNPVMDALLSIGLVDWEDGQILRTEEILVDPEGLECGEKAMAVNGIDLDVHLCYSIPRAEAAQRVAAFVGPMNRPWIAGHNAQFDIGFVRRLFDPAELRRLVSHRVMDTLQVLGYLGHVGIVPEGIGKLDQAIAHFGIEIEAGKRHTALADAVATAHLYTAMLNVARRRIA